MSPKRDSECRPEWSDDSVRRCCRSSDGAAQRVSLISVDNHEPDAYFPEPKPSMASNGSHTLAVLLRGEPSTEDTESEYKDLDMLEALARLLVEAQTW